MNLRKNNVTSQISYKFRNTLRVALDAVAACTARGVVVVVSDCMIATPNLNFESIFRDGAVTLFVNNT